MTRPMPHPAIPTRARAALLSLGAALLAACGGGPADGVALVGATVFDGTGAPPKPDMVVLVRKDTIAAIVPRATFELPRGMLEVDVSGKYIIPGLVDGHVHVATWALPRWIAAGVTSVRDVHGTLDWVMHLREQAALNATPSPRIYAAGAMIDASPATYPDALVVTDAAGARKAVDRLTLAGVDLVKGYTRLTPALFSAIVDEAQTFGLKVTAHLGLTDALTAADVGVKAIEHLSGIPEAARADASALYAAHRASFFNGWTAFERAWPGLDSAALERVARGLAEKQVTVIPTLVVHESFSRADAPDALEDPAIKAAVPDSEVTKWNLPDMLRRAAWTPADFQAFRAARANQDLFVRRFAAAGGRVVAGTDATNQLLVPGTALHRELGLLVRAGLTPEQALLAATRDAARLLGADSIGTLVPGRKADLVVLDADPLADIANVAAVSRVMLRGHLMPADSIRRAW